MEIIADTHIHFYPANDAARLVRGAAQRLTQVARSSAPVLALFLVEPHGFHYFAELRRERDAIGGGVAVEPSPEEEAVCVRLPDGPDVWLLAGRQMATSERMEILALTSATVFPERQPAERTVAMVLEAGAVPVLAWAVGKWMFRRAEVAGALCRAYGPDRLWLGDSALRPVGWPQPALMADPARRVLAGSDPLPVPGDEDQAGTYGIRLEGDFDARRPVTSFRRLLHADPAMIERVGKRNNVHTVCRRLTALQAARRAS